MKKITLFLLCICIIVLLVPGAVSADMQVTGKTAVLNMQFDAMPTNVSPYGVGVSKCTASVIKPEDGVRNKAMSVTKQMPASYAAFFLNTAAEDMVYQFDFMMEDTLSARSAVLANASGTTSSAFTINTSGRITLPDGRELLTLETGKWYTIALIYRFPAKRYELYLNGTCIADRIVISNAASLGSPTVFRISSAAGGYGSVYYIDNVLFCKGTEPADGSLFEKEVYNENVEEISETAAAEDTETVYINRNFDDETADEKPSGVWTLNTKDAKNQIVVKGFPDKKNKSLMISKNGSGDPYVDLPVSGFKASHSVLELSFYSEDTSSVKLITMRSTTAQFNEIFRLNAGGTIAVCGKTVATYEKKQWYDAALVIDNVMLTADVYINGELAAEAIPYSNLNFDTIQLFRLTMPASGASGTVYFDNIKYYAGSKIKTDEELSQKTAEPKKVNLITPEEDVKGTLENAVALLTNSGEAYANQEKITPSEGAYEENGVIYVPARLAAEGLGAEVSWNTDMQELTISLKGRSTVYRIGDTKAVSGGKTVTIANPPLLKNGSTMIPVYEFESNIADAEIKSSEKYGIVIIDGDRKSLTANQIKDIYNFIIYERPDTARILKDFEPMRGVHPRIMATADKFESIRRNVQTNEYMKKWYESCLRTAEGYLTKEHSSYKKSDGLRILNMSRQILTRSYTLGMAYQLTGDTRYAEYLWGEYEAAANFPDWNASMHFLDAAELTNGMAIGYDWCYDYWTPEQRGVIENAMMKFGLEPGMGCYNGTFSTRTGWIKVTNNWSQVCNGGLSVGALALMDVYPEFCSEMIEKAFLSLENMLGEFAPDGGWPEGPNYWNYCISYFTYHMSALNTALGTDYGYFDSNNIKNTCYYLTYVQGPQGLFNYHDSASGRLGSATVFYFSDKMNDPSLTGVRLNDMDCFGISGGTLDLLWFNPDMADYFAELPLDGYFRDSEMASFRSSFGDSEALYAGIHGGDNGVNHGNLDSGTFVIDAMGLRWAEELGADNYNLSDYFGTEGFKYYRLGAQGQNVLALNPVAEYGQEPTGFTTVKKMVSKDKGGYAVIDMSSAYGGKVSYAYRGLKMDAERTQVVVQDELNLVTSTDVWWFMHTKADIEIADGGRAVMLKKDGKRMYAVLKSNVRDAKFTSMAAEPLPGSANPSGQASNAAYKKLAVNIPNTKGDIKISVRFIPVYGDAMLEELLSNGTEPLIPMNSWTIDDGEISLPELDGIYIDGKLLDGFRKGKYIYNAALDFGSGTPEMTVDKQEGITAEITGPDEANGSAQIKVYRNDSPDDVRYYFVKFKVMPLIGIAEEYNPITPVSVTVSSEPELANPKENAIDGNTATRWSGEGYNEWLQLDLGEVREVNAVTMAFYNGKTRVSYFSISVSEDGRNWTTVYSGESSGVTDQYESYSIGDHRARYIRINGSGNNTNMWNSYSEVWAYGK